MKAFHSSFFVFLLISGTVLAETPLSEETIMQRNHASAAVLATSLGVKQAADMCAEQGFIAPSIASEISVEFNKQNALLLDTARAWLSYTFKSIVKYVSTEAGLAYVDNSSKAIKDAAKRHEEEILGTEGVQQQVTCSGLYDRVKGGEFSFTEKSKVYPVLKDFIDNPRADPLTTQSS